MQGISAEDLSDALPGVGLPQIAGGMTQLLQEGRVKVYQLQGGAGGSPLVYKVVSMEEAAKFATLSESQMILYRLVEGANREGIWKRQLKNDSKLSAPEFTKALKDLEKKQYIKSFKSIQSKNKVLYILFELLPAAEHVGDIWFTEDLELDKSFVDVMMEAAYKYINQRGLVSYADLKRFLNSIQLSTVTLEDSHVERLVYLLELDGKVETVQRTAITSGRAAKQEVLIKIVRVGLPKTMLMEVPCGTCPVFDLCTDHGDITPATCVYLKEWLGT
jgi:DNA-directed RNA polymerase III subunit RPC6